MTISPLGHPGYKTEGAALEMCTVGHLGAACVEEQGLANQVPEGPPTTHKCKNTLAAALFSPFEFLCGWSVRVTPLCVFCSLLRNH